ncbi:MAG TPA: glycosyltransferase [Anaerolineales bacterium]
MNPPQVSVIIPAFNQCAYLGAAVQSVLDQTFTDWELVVVDDGSTDNTSEVAARFSDPRIHVMRQVNKGLPGARNTGIAASSGEYLAFLDADDTYLPNKLEIQVAHLDKEPGVGLSYASRIEIDQQDQPSWLVRAPEQTDLRRLVLGFPFTINDLLVRRTWVERVGGFDETFRLHSEDRDFYLRLALAGCRFESDDHFLAYRRLHARRTFDRIPERIATMQRALMTAFGDPRCPADVLALQGPAMAQIFLIWGCQELVQGEVEAGRAHLREAARLDPGLFGNEAGGRSSSFVRFVVHSSVRDRSDHVPPVVSIFDGLPPELAKTFAPHKEWALARGYLIRGALEVLWGRLPEGQALLALAVEGRGRLDPYLMSILIDQLSSYELEFGPAKAHKVLGDLLASLSGVGTPAQVRWLAGYYSLNQAFIDYHRGCYADVLRGVVRAARADPTRMANMGVLSIFTRSLFGLAGRKGSALLRLRRA